MCHYPEDGAHTFCFLAVRPAWRRRGIATQLLNGVLAAAAAAGAPRVLIAVRLSLHENVRFFSARGFAATGEQLSPAARRVRARGGPMTRILVLGYRQGIDDAIVRRGLEPFFVVERVKPQLASRQYAQVASLEDAQEVLRVVLARGLGDLSAVVTGHEEAVFSAALLRSAFGLPGDADYARTLRFRDKYLQKRALPDDVPHARCEYATPATAYEQLAAAPAGRSRSSRPTASAREHTRVVRSAAELEDYWDIGASGQRRAHRGRVVRDRRRAARRRGLARRARGLELRVALRTAADPLHQRRRGARRRARRARRPAPAVRGG